MIIPQNHKGFTLLELMIVIAIVGVIAAMAVPSFSGNIERSRLKEAVESLKSDLMYARTQSIKTSSIIKVSLVKDGTGAWCYGINDADADCACGVVETADCGIKSIMGSRFKNVALNQAATVTFNPRRGTAGYSGTKILSTTNHQVKVVVSNQGRVTVCNVSGTMPGYEGC